MTLLPWALKAQARGLHIFPVARNQKIPHHLAGEWGKTATNDFNLITHFWTHLDPHANIGVACKPSELLVVDLDTAKEPGKLAKTPWSYLHDVYGIYVSGEEVFDEMVFKLADGNHEAYGTYTVKTPSGGTHLYYQWPTHWPRISQASPVKGVVDVRGNGGQWGGYVLGEGSVVNGATYRTAGTMRGVILPPEWIRVLVAERPQAPKVRRPGGIRQPGALSWSGLVDSVRNAGEGNRNNALLWAARSMYSDGAKEAEAQEVLGAAARDAGLYDFEIERTIASAYRIQQQKEG